MEEESRDSSTELVEYRWGHSEGITGVDRCLLDGQERLVTCGADCDLRVWKGFKDEDPVAYGLCDNGLALVCTENKEVYVATEFNTVEAISLEDGNSLGVKARFTAHVNHLDLSIDRSWLVAGSGDTQIKLINLEDPGLLPVTIQSHSAPVLSVALDPLKQFLASSGCDGNVCIWSLTAEGKPVHMVKKLEGIFPCSNDITLSSTLCRISWESNGKILAVPEDNHVALYARDTWVKLRVLKPQKSRKILSVTKFSQCSNYLAAGGFDGSLIVWDVNSSTVLVESAQFADHITGIIYVNEEADIIAADNKGRILLLKNFKTQSLHRSSGPNFGQQSKTTKNDGIESNIDSDGDIPSQGISESAEVDAFDDGMDDLFADQDNEISISKIKAETGFVDDEYIGVDAAQKLIIGDDLRSKYKRASDDEHDDDSVASFPRKPQKCQHPTPKIEIPFTEPQKPFQPASSPVHLDHRFMTWNNTGIIRNYSHDDDEKQAIDIEFHDAAVHHAIHLRNQDDYQLATLTKEVAVFSNEKQSETGLGSKLFCYNFTTWDSKKEWTTDLPYGEEIVGIAAGDGWIAASTDMNRVRIFTIGGVQRQIIEIGGQIIATSGHDELLVVVFHNGIGLHGNQCIAYSIFRIKPHLKPFPLISCDPLPISPKSQVSWIGFSDEGTPVCSDSRNVLRILSGRYWTTFCSLKEHLSANSSDNFWVVGVSELDQRIRAVKCRGMRYPPTLPRPVLMQLDAQIPFCEMTTDKSRLEDKYHRSLMLDALAKKMDKKNYEIEDYRSRAEKELKESLFNLFVLSCNENWDARGAEYVSMMPSAHAVQVAVKLASKLRKKGLEDRLTAIGRRKLDEEELENVGDDDDFETVKMGTIVYSQIQNRSYVTDYPASQDLFPETGSARWNTSTSETSSSFSIANGNRSVLQVPEDENPFIKRNMEEIRRSYGSTETAGTRFRKDKPRNSSENGETYKGLGIIDCWKKSTEKPTDLFGKKVTITKKVGGRKIVNDKDQTKGKEKKKQATLLDLGGRKGKDKDSNGNIANKASSSVVDIPEGSTSSPTLVENEGIECTHIPPELNLEDSTNSRCQDVENSVDLQKQPPKQGYMLWFGENKESLEKEHPDLGSRELTKIAMQMFRKLSPEEKKRYSSTNVQNETKKRKRGVQDDENSEPGSNNEDAGDKKSKLSSKLAAFVCSTAD